MAQQYPPASSFGTQYAQASFYPTFGSNEPGTSVPAAPSQQTAQHPNSHLQNPVQNTQRYDMNTQVPTAPLPFQLPTTFNPDFFKQLASSPLPPPPPPPPPPPNYSLSSLAPGARLSGPRLPSQNAHSYFQQATSASFQSGVSNHSPQNSGIQANVRLPATSSSNENPNPHLPSTQSSLPPNPSKALPYSFDGAGMSAMNANIGSKFMSNQESPALQEQTPSQTRSDSVPYFTMHQQQPNFEQHDTKERAKAAIMLLASSGITYQDFLKEGIDPLVLGSLYDELSLDKSEQILPDQPAHEDAKAQSSKTSPPATPNVTIQPATEAQNVATLDPGLERKDRIARLLAARKGQVSGGKTSQSASPATTPGSQSVQPTTVTKELSASRLSEPRAPSIRHTSNAEPQTIAIATDNNSRPTAVETALRSLPTPVRTQLEENGMSELIPGLFMTSAEIQERDYLIAEASAQAMLEDSARTELGKQTQGLVSDRLMSQADPTLQPVQKPAASNRDAAPPLHSIQAPDVEMSASISDIQGSDGSEEGEYDPEASEKIDHESSQFHDSDVASIISPPTNQNLFGNQSEIQNKMNVLRRRILEREHGNGMQSQPSADTQSVASPVSVRASHGDVSQKDSSSEKAEVATSPKGPRVDAGKLAARMAALKADLVAKNARKRALQDGMPALDAEIQNTRAQLDQMRAELTLVQSTIVHKTRELDEAKTHEQILISKVDTLERHLEDGVSGQKQFSNELNQLNNQLRGEETSPNVPSATKTAPPETRDSQIEHPPAQSVNQPEQQQVGIDSAGHEFDLLPDQTTDIPESANEDDGLDHLERRISNTSHSHDEGLAESGEDQMSIDEESTAETDQESGGSASMSDSGSDRYEPDEAGSEDFSLERANDSEYEPHDVQMNEDHEKLQTEDVEDYEPSEAIDVLDATELESLRREQDSSVAMSTQHPDSVTNGTGNVTPAFDEQPVSHISSPRPVGEDVDQAFPAAETGLSESVALGEENSLLSTHFMPYRSPLTPLKSFRFHPQFNELIKSGYRSLTYSNQIDPKRPLCPAELSGEVCTDENCEEQHFGTMALSDDKILVQMSSANDLKDKSQRDAYLIGLKKVIADLRERGVKEFSEVADALSKYRREWVEAQLVATS